jgi:PST family polysaccharide transporter
MTPFDSNGAFRPVTEGRELRRLAVRSAAATLSNSGVGFGIQVISTVVLGRLLTPADFGVVAMVSTFSGLLGNCGTNGFTEAVIQFQEMDHQTASNLFWLNSGLGLALAIAFVAAGSLLTRFYGNPLVANVATGLSFANFIAAASVMHLALLRRAMRFAAASANDVLGRVANIVVSILLALNGWGYWALVAGTVAQQLSVTAGAWWLCRWVPSFPRRTRNTGPMVRFAASVYGRFSVRYTTQNIDYLLVGWRFNAVALGFYKKAYDLFVLSASQFTAPLHHVALAALSRLNHDPARFRRYLVNSLGIIAFLGMAAGGILTLVGGDVVRLVLGPKWSESGRIFKLFGPGIGVMVLSSTVGWIHLSIGQPGRFLRWTLAELIVTTSLFLLALPWGPSGIAAAWSVSYWILLVPAFWYAGRPLGLAVSSLIFAVWRYAAASVVAGLTTAIIRGTLISAPSLGAWGALEAIVFTSSLFIPSYVCMVILLHWGCAPLRQLASLLRELAPSPKVTRPASEPV